MCVGGSGCRGRLFYFILVVCIFYWILGLGISGMEKGFDLEDRLLVVLFWGKDLFWRRLLV